MWVWLTDFFIDDEEAVKSKVERQQGKGGGRVLARAWRARLPWEFRFFAFTTFTERWFFQWKVVLERCPALRTFFLEKMNVYSLSSQAKLNTVPNTLVICCKIVCYERICEGCESKKYKTAGCACTRALASPLIKRKGKRKSGWGRRAKAGGQWEIKTFDLSQKTWEKKRKAWEIFQKTWEKI